MALFGLCKYFKVANWLIQRKRKRSKSINSECKGTKSGRNALLQTPKKKKTFGHVNASKLMQRQSKQQINLMSTGPGKIFSVAFRETCEKKSEEQIEKLFWPKLFKRNLFYNIYVLLVRCRFHVFSSKLNHVILIWGSCLSHCPYLKKSVFNDDSN